MEKLPPIPPKEHLTRHQPYQSSGGPISWSSFEVYGALFEFDGASICHGCIVDEDIGRDEHGRLIVFSRTGCHGDSQIFIGQERMNNVFRYTRYLLIQVMGVLAFRVGGLLGWAIGTMGLPLILIVLTSKSILRHLDQFLDSLAAKYCGSFTYTGISSADREIRLLEILPGSGAEPLRCRLKPVAMANITAQNAADEHAAEDSNTSMSGAKDLAETNIEIEGNSSSSVTSNAAAPYLALSYSWDAILPKRSTRIAALFRELLTILFSRIQGKTRPTPIRKEVRVEIDQRSFFITQTLAHALLNLRNTNSICVLWCDQLCIDQACYKDKGTQIAMMADIYKHAAKVIVWLDLPDRGECLHHEAVELLKSAVDPRKLSRLSSAHLSCVRNLLQTIVQCRWWSRVWVIQEVALAEEIEFRMQSAQISWDTLTTALTTDALIPGPSVPPRIHRLIRLVQYHRRPTIQSPMRLTNLMAETKDFFASDLRDKLYSLRGLLGQSRAGDQWMVRIRMEQSSETFFADLAKQFINRRASLVHLAASESRWVNQRDQKSLTQCGTNDWRGSWSPQWFAQIDQIRNPLWEDNGLELNQTSELAASTKPRGRFIALNHIEDAWPESYHLLTLEGYILGEICHISDEYDRRCTANQRRKVLKAWQSIGGECADEAKFKRLDPRRLESLCLETRIRCEKSWDLSLPCADEVLTILDIRCSGRRLSKLQDGTLGLGHSDCRPADLVVQFLGAGIPYIIRRTHHSGYGWRHSGVGSCLSGCPIMFHASCCLKETYMIIGQIALERAKGPVHSAAEVREFILE